MSVSFCISFDRSSSNTISQQNIRSESLVSRTLAASTSTIITIFTMKYTLAAVAALVSTVSATAVDLEKRASPLSVDLTPVSDTKVKVALTNTGSTSYNLFYKGTFLDTDSPADKLYVNSACMLRCSSWSNGTQVVCSC